MIDIVMEHKLVYSTFLTVALFGFLVVGTGSAAAQTVDDIEVILSDSDEDNLEDSFTVNVRVTDDGAVTAVRLNGPVDTVEIPSRDDGSSQAPITNVSDRTAAFGSTGYTGTYTVEGTLSGQSKGDIFEIMAWVGDIERSQADDVEELTATISGSSETDDDGSSGADEEDETPNSGTNTSENDEGSDEGTSSDNRGSTSDESEDGNAEKNSDEDTADGGNTTGESEENNIEKNGNQDSGDGNGTGNGEGLPGFTAVVALFVLTLVAVGVRRYN